MGRLDADALIVAIAARQHGRIALEQLAAAGVSEKQVRVRVKRGTLHRLHRGVYGLAPSRTPEERWMAGVLAGGEGACLVLESAASLLGMFRRRLISPVHVNSRTHRQSRNGLRFHQITLGDGDIETWRGIPTTTPMKTLEDLRGRTPRAEWEQLVIRAVAEAIVGRDALTLFKVGKPMTRSRLERIALGLVTVHGLPKPEVNVQVLGSERDLVWRGHRLVVEIDGPHHLLPPQIRRDNQRDRELTLNGWIPLRYAEDELLAAPGELRTLLLGEPSP